jgi:ATP-dependent Lhr-like helicase
MRGDRDLHGRQGESTVEHYGFHATFKMPEEYRITRREQMLGTLPLTQVVAPGLTLILAGRRWRIVEVRDRERLIEVAPDRSGQPPLWQGDGGPIHDRVVGRMRAVLEGHDRLA